MEAYTNIRIEMENNELAKEAIKKTVAVIKAHELFGKDEGNITRFIEDIRIEDEDIIKVNDSCSLDSYDYEELIPLMMKAIAAIDEVKTFKATSFYDSSNSGFEAYCNANYWNETLTIEQCGGESFYGSCDECGEFEISWEDYDPNKTYICPECGKELTEEDLFPYGVPERTIETYEIW